VDNPDMIHQTDSGRSSRRGILAALGLGSAATALFAAAQPAQAQTTDTTVAPTAETTPGTEPMLVTASPDTTEAAPIAALTSATPETTLPPKKVQPEDLPLLGAGKVLELTAAEACDAAAARTDGLGLDDAGKEFLAALGAHHRAYAEALSALYGPGSPSTPNDALLELLGGNVFAEGSASDALKALHDLEHHCSDTHQTLLGVLLSTDAAALVASIQVVEARHGTVLGLLLGQTYGADELAIEDAADALSVAQITGGK
jgi:hypothetical protein